MSIRGRLLTASLVSSAAALAVIGQTAPILHRVPQHFYGISTNSRGDTIQILQPDGGFVRYSGPLPPDVFQQGDEVAISFEVTVPSKGQGLVAQYHGQRADDGIYHFRVVRNRTIPGDNGFVSEGVLASKPDEGVAVSSLTVVLDSKNAGFSIEGDGDERTAGLADAANASQAAGDEQNGSVLDTNDPAAGDLSYNDLISNDHRGEVQALNNFGAGTPDQLGSSDAERFGATRHAEAGSATKVSNDPVVVAGSTESPQVATSDTPDDILDRIGLKLAQLGRATEVPEPGVTGLFALALGALFIRRKRRTA